jgi:hypothetical protein
VTYREEVGRIMQENSRNLDIDLGTEREVHVFETFDLDRICPLSQIFVDSRPDSVKEDRSYPQPVFPPVPVPQGNPSLNDPSYLRRRMFQLEKKVEMGKRARGSEASSSSKAPVVQKIKKKSSKKKSSSKKKKKKMMALIGALMGAGSSSSSSDSETE